MLLGKVILAQSVFIVMGLDWEMDLGIHISKLGKRPTNYRADDYGLFNRKYICKNIYFFNLKEPTIFFLSFSITTIFHDE